MRLEQQKKLQRQSQGSVGRRCSDNRECKVRTPRGFGIRYDNLHVAENPSGEDEPPNALARTPEIEK